MGLAQGGALGVGLLGRLIGFLVGLAAVYFVRALSLASWLPGILALKSNAIVYYRQGAHYADIA